MIVRWKTLPAGARIALDLDAEPEVKGGGRYPNIKKPTIDNVVFDSEREMQRYLELKLIARAGVIRDLELQPRFPIIIGGIQVRIRSKRYHKNGRQVVYIADFRYFDRVKNIEVIEDVKMQSGHRTEGYILKRAMVEAMGIEITEV